MKVDVLLGLQWGDEGKGKIVDVISSDYDIIARFQGGPNAGHTLKFNNQKHVLHLLPSGIFNPKIINIIGNGVVIDPLILFKEIDNLTTHGIDAKPRLLISKRANLILPSHRLLDAAQEFAKGITKVGSTLKGIGPTYTDKIARNAVRVGDILKADFVTLYNNLKEKHLETINHLKFDYSSYLIDGESFADYETKWLAAINRLKEYTLIDSEHYINEALKTKKILAEGAQGTMLDIDFGSYPFVTSSNTITAGACTGLGISPSKIGKVIGITKAYCTRVGNGPFPTELFDEDGEKLRVNGCEFGSTTGRPRRCGWVDLPALKYAIMINGVTELILMKVDVLNDFKKVKVCTHYEQNNEKLDYFPYEIETKNTKPIYKEFDGWNNDFDIEQSVPEELSKYIDYLENEFNVPITIVSVGPDRKQTIFRKEYINK